jgi:hypothetical protein
MLTTAVVIGATAHAAVAQSALESMRTRADALFGSALTVARQDADHVTVARRQYEAACHGKVTTTRAVYPQGIPLDRTPIGAGALVSTGGLPQQPATPLRFETRNETTPLCRALRSDIVSGVAAVEARLADVAESARRAGIYPGVMRDLRQAHGFAPLD